MAGPVRNIPKPQPRKKAASRHAGRNRILLLAGGMLAALFILLSILTYGGANDEMILDGLSFIDAFRIPFDDVVRAGVSGLENPLGLIGAFTAHFFVDLTVGYASLVFPLIILWCSILLARGGKEHPVLVTNYALLYALLIPSTLAALRYSVDAVGKAWYGLVGAFVADLLVSLLGSIGALIFLLAALGAATVYLLNVDLGTLIEKTARPGQGAPGPMEGALNSLDRLYRLYRP